MNENTPQNVSKSSSIGDEIGIIKILVCLKSKWNFLLVFLFFGIALAETGPLSTYGVLEREDEVLLTSAVEDTHLKQNIEKPSADNGFCSNLLDVSQQLHVVLAGFSPLMLDKSNRKLLFVMCMFVFLLLRKMQDNKTKRGYLLKQSPKGLCEMLKNGTFSDVFVVKLIDYFYVLRANARVENPGCLLNCFRFYALLVKKHAIQTNESIQDASNTLLTAVRKFLYRRLLSSTSVNVMRGSAMVAPATMAITRNFNQ